MTNTCKSKWEPTKEQIENKILPSYTEMAKQSVHLINEIKCPPEYVADMLRDIADALISAHPESDNEY